VTLRPATADDAALLLAWRNDPVTRAASRTTRPIGADEHRAWLARTLSDSARRLMIAVAGGRAVGMVRADRCDAGWELSWAIAPEARGNGYGKRAVALLARDVGGAVCAHIRAGNAASEAVARAAGMAKLREYDDGFSYWQGKAT
jgi:RimJ/RimL family protein N-acetyltransferase